MAVKTPIKEVPWIYRIKPGITKLPACVCREHKYIVVVKYGSQYYITTIVQPPFSVDYIHCWTKRDDDPLCLEFREPFKPLEPTKNSIKIHNDKIPNWQGLD